MPKRKTPSSTEFPFHITARTNNREPFAGELGFVWKTFTGELLIQHHLHGIRVHAFVLMPNHFHLLVSSPSRPVGDFMRDFLGSSTRIINCRNQRTGHITGGPYFGSLISDPTYYLHAFKYVIRNPVRGGLIVYPAEYPFSTYSNSLGFGHLGLPIFPPNWSLDHYLPQDPESMDTWLNKPHRMEELELIRKGLRKKEFDRSTKRTSRRKQTLSI